jgi:hypothetical protein
MTPQDVAALLPEVQRRESASMICHSSVELGAEDTVIQSGEAKPGRPYPKVGGHPKPPIGPAHPGTRGRAFGMDKGFFIEKNNEE